jgi:6-phosphofructokinase 1
LKYLAASLMEAARDHCAMATKPSVFILEVMGRHTGWLTACGAVARLPAAMSKPLMLFPERIFQEEAFVAAVRQRFEQHPACVCVVSEGIRTEGGAFYAQQNVAARYGHEQLGGAGSAVAALLRDKLGVKVHVAVPDYMQRAARHVASATDIAQAEAVAQHAVQLVQQGQSGVMVNIVRDAETPYAWHCASVPLATIANRERCFPDAWIDGPGFGVTDEALQYLRPLIQGEAPVLWRDGLPDYPWVEWPLIQ